MARLGPEAYPAVRGPCPTIMTFVSRVHLREKIFQRDWSRWTLPKSNVKLNVTRTLLVIVFRMLRMVLRGLRLQNAELLLTVLDTSTSSKVRVVGVQRVRGQTRNSLE